MSKPSEQQEQVLYCACYYEAEAHALACSKDTVLYANKCLDIAAAKELPVDEYDGAIEMNMFLLRVFLNARQKQSSQNCLKVLQRTIEKEPSKTRYIKYFLRKPLMSDAQRQKFSELV